VKTLKDLLRNKRRFKYLAQLALIFILLGFMLFIGFFIITIRDIPDPSTIITRRVSQSTQIFDASGASVLYDIHGEEKRTVVPWDKISQSVKDATVASEDADFYKHNGIDLRGIARAMFKNLRSLEISQGGSTITQQLVKNALLVTDRTFTRKLKELILTLEIERRFTKDQILEMYLNQIPYGSNAYGIEAASQLYFGKHASDLSYAEAATISALIQAPTFYSPYGNNVPVLIQRQRGVINKLYELGLVDEKTRDLALAEDLIFQPSSQDIQAPHFVIMVREYLISRFGEDAVENGGLKVTTTLDPELQTLAEESIEKYAQINEQRYRSSNAALVAIDPRTGQIKALVGSRDYFDIENEGNFNVATAFRQPGSAFKPFAYATAFSKGFTDSTVIFDVSTEFNPNCSPEANQNKDRFGLDCYHPNNYDFQFHGPVTMRQALARSLNVPAVKTLYLSGVDAVIETATRLGITSLEENRSRFGLSLVLGGAEVRLLDITSAYGVFGNDGIKNNPTFILKIEDSAGNILEEWVPQEKRVLDRQIARTINDILADNIARAPTFGVNSPFVIPGRNVAAKTGTTQNNRDGWLIGYTPALSVGVWTGNNNNTPMNQNGLGINTAGPIWNDFMRQALQKTANESFPPPEPNFSDKIMLNGYYGEIPNVHNILWFVDKNNPHGAIPENPFSDPSSINWESAVRKKYGPTQDLDDLN